MGGGHRGAKKAGVPGPCPHLLRVRPGGLVTLPAARTFAGDPGPWLRAVTTATAAVNLSSGFPGEVWPATQGPGVLLLPGAGWGFLAEPAHGTFLHRLSTAFALTHWSSPDLKIRDHTCHQSKYWALLLTHDGMRPEKKMPALFHHEIRHSFPSGEGKPSNAFNISASLGRLLSFFTRAHTKNDCFWGLSSSL